MKNILLKKTEKGVMLLFLRQHLHHWTIQMHNLHKLLYGRSITDSCISIQETYEIIGNAYQLI